MSAQHKDCICNVYDIDSRKHLHGIFRFFFLLSSFSSTSFGIVIWLYVRRREKKKISRISKPHEVDWLEKSDAQCCSRDRLCWKEKETLVKQKWRMKSEREREKQATWENSKRIGDKTVGSNENLRTCVGWWRSWEKFAWEDDERESIFFFFFRVRCRWVDARQSRRRRRRREEENWQLII